MVEGIVLAAGQSRRTSPRCKLLLASGGMPLLVHAVRGMLSACGRVLVVTGAHAQAVTDAIRDMRGVVPVHNPDYMDGMFGSVKTGLREAQADEVFVLPGDCPFVPPDVYRALLAAPGGVVLPTWRGGAGHPALLRRPAIATLLADDAFATLRDFIAAFGEERVEVESRAILDDIDTLEDFRQAAPRTNGGENRQ